MPYSLLSTFSDDNGTIVMLSTHICCLISPPRVLCQWNVTLFKSPRSDSRSLMKVYVSPRLNIWSLSCRKLLFETQPSIYLIYLSFRLNFSSVLSPLRVTLIVPWLDNLRLALAAILILISYWCSKAFRWACCFGQVIKKLTEIRIFFSGGKEESRASCLPLEGLLFEGVLSEHSTSAAVTAFDAFAGQEWVVIRALIAHAFGVLVVDWSHVEVNGPLMIAGHQTSGALKQTVSDYWSPALLITSRLIFTAVRVEVQVTAGLHHSETQIRDQVSTIGVDRIDEHRLSKPLISLNSIECGLRDWRLSGRVWRPAT